MSARTGAWRGEAMDDYQQPPPLSGARMWLAGIGLALANFVVILDLTITNVSVPHIAGGLAISPSQGTWTITSYAVAEAITVPLSGWLSVRFGTLRTLVWTLLGFGLFSVLCGLARTIEMLVVLRVLQGLCGRSIAGEPAGRVRFRSGRLPWRNS